MNFYDVDDYQNYRGAQRRGATSAKSVELTHRSIPTIFY